MDQCQGFLGSFEIGPTEQALLSHALTSMDNHTLGFYKSWNRFLPIPGLGIEEFLIREYSFSRLHCG